MNLPDVFDAILEFGGDIAVGGAKQAGRSLIAGYLKRKADAARDILLEEIQTGETLPPQGASSDDTVAVIFRYLRAANEGAARVNLRLLAKAIVGNLRTGSLVADEFQLYADALANLSRDEIIVIGALWRQREAPEQFQQTTPEARPYGWPVVVASLEGSGWKAGRAQDAATRAQRSGLVIASVHSGFGSATISFAPSTMMEELAKTVDFEDALRAEGIAL